MLTKRPTIKPIAEIIPSSESPIYFVGTKDRNPIIEGTDAIEMVFETKTSSDLRKSFLLLFSVFLKKFVCEIYRQPDERTANATEIRFKEPTVKSYTGSNYQSNNN